MREHRIDLALSYWSIWPHLNTSVVFFVHIVSPVCRFTAASLLGWCTSWIHRVVENALMMIGANFGSYCEVE